MRRRCVRDRWRRAAESLLFLLAPRREARINGRVMPQNKIDRPAPEDDVTLPIAGSGDQAALRNCLRDDVALCTLVGIDGSFSRRRGAQLAVAPQGVVAGSLSDSCLEHQLVREAREAREEGRPRLLRFGKGSPLIDFRLPCGGGLDILVDPFPDRDQCKTVLAALDDRKEAKFALPVPEDAPSDLIRDRSYTPSLRLQLFGESMELRELARLAAAVGVNTEVFQKQGSDGGILALGRPPEGLVADRWTAILLLFHDHDWEQAILEWALTTQAFFIGAQGGRLARESRLKGLMARRWTPKDLDRIHSPIGLIPHAREPAVLALSALAQIVGAYDGLHPHR